MELVQEAKIESLKDGQSAYVYVLRLAIDDKGRVWLQRGAEIGYQDSWWNRRLLQKDDSWIRVTKIAEGSFKVQEIQRWRFPLWNSQTHSFGEYYHVGNVKVRPVIE